MGRDRGCGQGPSDRNHDTDIGASFFRMSLDLLAVANQQGYFVNLNPRWAEVLGHTEAILLARPFLEFVHPDDVAETLAAAAATREPGGRIVDFTNRYRCADGTYRTLAWRATTLDNGLIIANARDVTLEQHHLTSLEVRNEKLALAEEMSGLGHWTVHLHGDTPRLEWSDQVFEIHGRDPALGEPCLEDAILVYHPDDRDAVAAKVEQAIAEKQPFRFEKRVIRSDGVTRWVVSQGRPLVGMNGEVLSIFGTYQDITEHREMVARLEALVRENQEQRAHAESANRAKSEFLATMSHEIRTPMNGVLGMARLLSETRLSDEQQELLENLRASAEGLLTVINDVLELSRMEAGRIVLSPVDFDLGATLGRVEKMLGLDARNKGLRLEVQADVEARGWYRGDEGRLRQILVNLVGNAIKFTETGFVRLSATCTADGCLRFAIEDTGIGMDAAALGRVFEKFIQADSSTSRRYGGSGLGLTICRQLAALMEGTLTARSQPGVGSEFVLTLPFEPGKAAPTIVEHSDAMPALRRGLRVLVAEDNQVNQLITRRFLDKLGAQCTMTENGREAVAAAASAPFDAILMDIQMPGLDGIAATRRIRALDSAAADLPIVALTANAMEGDRERYLDAGMDGYISKPVTLEAIAQELGRAIAAKQRGEADRGLETSIANADPAG